MNAKLIPSPRGRMRWLVKVKRVNGEWTAVCRAKRCKFNEPHFTRTGAEMAAARHRRDKALTKMHGATEATS